MSLLDATSTGFQRALVTDNKDPEHLGRVKVRYPAYRGDGAGEISDWARVALPFASASAGFWSLPDEGDEVLILFEGGDAHRPIVLGSLHGPKNKPPEGSKSGDLNKDGKNSLKLLKTKGGNFIALDDTSGKSSVHLYESGGASLKIENGKVALGAGSAELLDLFEQLLDSIQNNAPTFVSTAMGPGLLNPGLVAKVTSLKASLASIKGKL